MGAVQLPNDLMRVIEQRVANGQAANLTAFVQEAVSRLLDDTDAEQDDLERAGLADTEAGRTTTIATVTDEQTLHDRIIRRLRNRMATKQ